MDDDALGIAASAALDAAPARLEIPLKRPATVTAGGGALVAVVVDGDSASTVVTTAQNLTGQSLAAGDRVMIEYQPPHGVFVVGIINTNSMTTYTPTLTQLGALTKTVTTAEYMKHGRLVTVLVDLAITSGGTGNNAVLVGLPIPAAKAPAANAYQTIGSFTMVDSSVGFYAGSAVLASITTVGGIWGAGGAGFLIGSTPNFAVVNGDFVSMAVTYPAATTEP